MFVINVVVVELVVLVLFVMCMWELMLFTVSIEFRKGEIRI